MEHALARERPFNIGRRQTHYGRQTQNIGTLRAREPQEVRKTMWGLIVLLVVVWLAMTLVGSMGSVVHLILVLAVALLLWNLFTGRRAIT